LNQPGGNKKGQKLT